MDTIRAQLHIPAKAATVAQDVGNRLARIRLMQPGAWASAVIKAILADDPETLYGLLPKSKIRNCLLAEIE